MTVYYASNASQLQNAIGKVVGGDSIVLRAGGYGNVSISNLNLSAKVTIRSASDSAPAHFDQLNVLRSSNLVFDGLDVGRGIRAGEDTQILQLARITDSTNITISNTKIHGSLDGNPHNDGAGLTVSGVSNLQLVSNQFVDLRRGALIQASSNVKLKGNEFDTIRVDGLDVAGVKGISILGNSFQNFFPIKGDHADAIQFFNTNQKTGSSNIRIENNVVMQKDGVGTQGIFISDARGFVYDNVVIKNNILYGNDFYHGITVNNGRNVQIVQNSVLSEPSDKEMFWIRVNDSVGVRAANNIADKIVFSNVSALSQSNNVDLFKAPAARHDIGDLYNPDSPFDLILDSVGYRTTTVAQGGASVSTPTPSPSPTISVGVSAVGGSAGSVQDLPIKGHGGLIFGASQDHVQQGASPDSGGGSWANPYYGEPTLRVQQFDHFVAHP